MYKENDIIVYRKDVCKINKIKNEGNDTYYVMNPIDDSTLSIKVPTESNLIRDIITKKELSEIIKQIPNIEPIKELNDKYIEHTYRELLQSGNYEDLIKIIKSSYIRNHERLENNKKMSERDEKFFNLAEKYLYNEFSVVLDMTFDETKEYIISKVKELASNN